MLIALVDGHDGAEVLLTRRAWHLTHHKGEVSFPGGRMDPGETPVETALREAHEEVALDPALVEVLGELDHFRTVVSRSYIVPSSAGWPSDRDSGRRTTRSIASCSCPWPNSPGPTRIARSAGVRRPTDWPIHFFELDDETIWGATARMLAQLLALAHGRITGLTERLTR